MPYLCIGAGCGAFGHGMGELIGRRALKHAQDVRRQIEIEQKDERNIAIMNRAKGKAYDAMIYIFGALMVSFALMELEMLFCCWCLRTSWWWGFPFTTAVSITERCKGALYCTAVQKAVGTCEGIPPFVCFLILLPGQSGFYFAAGSSCFRTPCKPAARPAKL